MAEERTDVLVAGYRNIDTSTRDFEQLVARVTDKSIKIDAVILVPTTPTGTCPSRRPATTWVARVSGGAPPSASSGFFNVPEVGSEVKAYLPRLRTAADSRR
ncbi:MAG: hypothetical protein R6X29_02635 [Acidimicrobiia bacterium]|jgi:hypothetical protein